MCGELLTQETINNTKELGRELAPAHPASRALAAFVDYLLLMALLMFFSGYLFGFDYEFLWSFLLGAGYFSLGNSEITGGQTLGKRAFGLRLVGQAGPISVPRSFARFVCSHGLPILLTGIPPLILRESEVVASASITDLPMLFVLVYTIWNLSSIFVSRLNLAKHDEFCNTVVLRIDGRSQASSVDYSVDQTSTSLSRTASYIPLLLALLLGGTAWLYSVFQPQSIEPIHRHRYQLERQFSIRILSLSNPVDGIVMHLAALDAKQSDLAGLTERLARHLLKKNLLPQEGRMTLLFVVLLADEGNRRVQPTEYRYTLEQGTLTPLTDGANQG